MLPSAPDAVSGSRRFAAVAVARRETELREALRRFEEIDATGHARRIRATFAD